MDIIWELLREVYPGKMHQDNPVYRIKLCLVNGTAHADYSFSLPKMKNRLIELMFSNVMLDIDGYPGLKLKMESEGQNKGKSTTILWKSGSIMFSCTTVSYLVHSYQVVTQLLVDQQQYFRSSELVLTKKEHKMFDDCFKRKYVMKNVERKNAKKKRIQLHASCDGTDFISGPK